jgi:hypothetical protein
MSSSPSKPPANLPARRENMTTLLSGEGFQPQPTELFQSRYSNITSRRHIRSAKHFVDWAACRSVPVARWDEHLLGLFGRHLSGRRCGYGHTVPVNQITATRLFLRHLRNTGLVTSPTVDPVVSPALLVAFRQWMRQQRGTCDLTLDNYDRRLLKRLGDTTNDRYHASRTVQD